MRRFTLPEAIQLLSRIFPDEDRTWARCRAMFEAVGATGRAAKRLGRVEISQRLDETLAMLNEKRRRVKLGTLARLAKVPRSTVANRVREDKSVPSGWTLRPHWEKGKP